MTTNFPFTPECGLSVSHRLDIMRALRDLTHRGAYDARRGVYDARGGIEFHKLES